MSEPITLVSFLPSEKPYSCGYCKEEGSLSDGMWAHYMSVGVYQQLIDKGWRRSGRYVYKPIMDKTCCPLYTIRCESDKFQPTKSQKKVAKKVRNFLLRGSKKIRDEESNTIDTPKDVNKDENADTKDAKTEDNSKASQSNCDKGTGKETELSGGDVDMDRKILGLKKAKIRRLERRLEKKGFSKDCKKLTEPKNKEKGLSDLLPSLQTATDLLNASVSQGGDEFKHKLELRLIKADQQDAQFQHYFQESFEVYKKYQMNIHKDPEEDCDERTFKRFLCNSPLKYQSSGGNNNVLLGAFHQHYILDGKIIAVAVLDILPDCISSVYFYYDPAFSFLSLGTYSAIREIQLCVALSRKYYYMGYYIHSCHKMRYKGKYNPSELCSPTSYKWHPIEKCIPYLDQNKFTTFEKEPELMVKKKTLNMSRVRLFFAGDMLLYSEGFMDTLSQKGQANLRGYFEICDSLAENIIVVVNDEEGDSDDE